MRPFAGVLRHRDFRLLFWGQSASTLGDQVVVVALALYVTRATGSATDLGLILAAQSLPFVLLLLFGGVWADRLERHRIMIVCDLVRAGLHGLLAALILLGSAGVPALIVIEAAFGAARAFFQPAYTGLVPQTVPESEIQDARALTQSTANLALTLGPALATALVLGLGAGEAFALDAATFILSAWLLAGVRPRSRVPEAAGAASQDGGRPGTMLDEIRGGYREVRSRPWVWVTIAAFTGIIFAVYAQWYALAPLVARDRYGGAGVFGVLEAASGAGSVVAAFVGLRWRPARPMRAGLLLTLLWPLQCIVFAIVVPLGVVVAVTLCAGFGVGLFIIWWETALAHYVPPGALSRVSSYDYMGSLALAPVGFAVAGPLGAALGARTVLAAGGVAGLVLLLVALAPRSTRELGRFPGGSAEQVPGHVGVEPGRDS